MQEDLKGTVMRRGNLVPVLAGVAVPRLPTAFGQQSTQMYSTPSLSVVLNISIHISTERRPCPCGHIPSGFNYYFIQARLFLFLLIETPTPAHRRGPSAWADGAGGG